MKLNYFSALLVFWAVMGQAQEKKNMVKTNVTAFAFRNLNLTYERAINDRFAVNIGYSIVGKGDIPMVKAFLSDEDLKDFKDIQVSSNAFTLEFRAYFGKNPNSGFYLAPYYRNSKLKIDGFTYEFEYSNPNTSTTETIPVKMNGDVTSNSVGLMIGNQWLLGKNKNWVLDFWIVGGHYGKGKGDLNGITSRTLTPDEQEALRRELEDLDIPVVKYTTEVNANGGKVKVDGPWAGLRSGLSFGYRF